MTEPPSTPMVTIRMERACWQQIVSDIENMCGTGAEDIEILQCAEVTYDAAQSGAHQTAATDQPGPSEETP